MFELGHCVVHRIILGKLFKMSAAYANCGSLCSMYLMCSTGNDRGDRQVSC
jgi:hypothetical protein